MSKMANFGTTTFSIVCFHDCKLQVCLSPFETFYLPQTCSVSNNLGCLLDRSMSFTPLETLIYLLSSDVTNSILFYTQLISLEHVTRDFSAS